MATIRAGASGNQTSKNKLFMVESLIHFIMTFLEQKTAYKNPFGI